MADIEQPICAVSRARRGGWVGRNSCAWRCLDRRNKLKGVYRPELNARSATFSGVSRWGESNPSAAMPRLPSRGLGDYAICSCSISIGTTCSCAGPNRVVPRRAPAIFISIFIVIRLRKSATARWVGVPTIACSGKMAHFDPAKL